MENESSLVEHQALEILESYSGANNYIIFLKQKKENSKKFYPTRAQSDYIVNYHNTAPKVARKWVDLDTYFAKKFAEDYACAHWTTEMEEAIAHPSVDIVCIALPNNLHEAAVMLCCKHKKAVMTTKPLGRNAAEAKRMLLAVEEAGIFNGYLEDLVYTR